ncbi:pol [Symbiodinium necroappetens]|uniref:Pol protein n=1 Tax=Symbiodinium necroappetens TaxID=1628268 RepID=A0A812M3A2_9DINO|nr:pol [Symbiodinium necroappetens]
MPPQQRAAATTKGSGKNKAKPENAQSSTVEFGLPATMVTALQSISSRATQDLWASSAFASSELTADQMAQRRSNATAKLSKRITGNMKARMEFAASLSAWMGQLSQHLMGLLGRVRAISAKVDEDSQLAIQEMQSFLAAQPSVATQEQIHQAQRNMGPTWSPQQEQEIIRIAAAMKAFGSVAFPVAPAPTGLGPDALPGSSLGPSDIHSEVSFGGVTIGYQDPPTGEAAHHPTFVAAAPSGALDAMAPTTPARRWKRQQKEPETRPSKSPRRDVCRANEAPWASIATGYTPESLQRPSRLADHEEELVPDNTHSLPSAMPSWFTGWLFTMRFAIEQGGEVIGELIQHPEQDALLPLQRNADVASVVREAAQVLWHRLQHIVGAQDESSVPTMLEQMRSFLQQLRMCPQVLPELPQGLVLAVQASLGFVLDPFSFAPSTAQEWLFPSLLLEHGGPFCGFVPLEASPEPHVQMLLSLPPPGVVTAMPANPAPAGFDEECRRDPGYALPSGLMSAVCCGPSAFKVPVVPVDRITPLDPFQVSRCGNKDSEWNCRRLNEPLPAFPSEQYVWSPQSMPSLPAPPPGDSLPASASIDDRFALSLDRTPGTEAAFHEVVGANAVILGVNGHVYADVPTFADHQIIRSAALQAYLRHERGPQEALHFVRIMPPLQGLPAIQFAAVQCGGTDLPAVVDMRPLGGG